MPAPSVGWWTASRSRWWKAGRRTPSIPPTEWRFENGKSPFTAVTGVSGLTVRDGLLHGRATSKLIQHRTREEGTPEFELFAEVKDPLGEILEPWYKMANAARLAPDSETMEGLSQQRLERLRSLGYIK